MTHPSTISIPVLETERLRLRGHSPDDFEALTAIWADPAVTHYIGVNPSSPSDAWARLLRYVGHWALFGYGFWAVEEKASGRLVGDVGVAEFKRGLEPPLTAPEFGWVLAPWSHGKGYATEAAGAALAWAFTNLGPIEAACLINPDNAPSLRVAQKLGFREKLRASYLGQPTIILSTTLSPKT